MTYSPRIYIKGMGSYLPKNVLLNDDISTKYNLDTSDEWIVSRTGIKQRHIASNNDLTSDLATNALTAALDDAGIRGTDLDSIIVATTTPDITFPSTAVHIQNNVGANNAFAFDLQAVCAGFVYAMSTAYSMMLVHDHITRVAVIGADIMSRIVDWQDRSTAVLFGDGAGAFILEKDSTTKDTNSGNILGFQLESNSSLIDILKTDSKNPEKGTGDKITMKGREVYKYAVTTMSNLILQSLADSALTINDLDLLVPHQANIRIIQAISQKLEFDMNKIAQTVSLHANTSAASIPLALHHCRTNGQLKRGDIVSLVAVGGGMTAGSILLKY